MNKVIFVVGVRGVGKTTVLNHFRKFRKFACIEFYSLLKRVAKVEKVWPSTEQKIAFKNKVTMIALHCAVPHEDLFEDIKKDIRRDFSQVFDVGLTPRMIRSMKSKKTNFVFIYIKVNSRILMQRLKRELKRYSRRVSREYLKNLERIKRIDYLKFKKILSEFKKYDMKFKYFIISNDGLISNTLNHVKKIIYDEI